VVIRGPKIPIPIEATPIARRYGGPLVEVGTVVAMRPKRRMAMPTIATPTIASLGSCSQPMPTSSGASSGIPW
jgi:hypothetical protein